MLGQICLSNSDYIYMCAHTITQSHTHTHTHLIRIDMIDSDHRWSQWRRWWCWFLPLSLFLLFQSIWQCWIVLLLVSMTMFSIILVAIHDWLASLLPSSWTSRLEFDIIWINLMFLIWSFYVQHFQAVMTSPGQMCPKSLGLPVESVGHGCGNLRSPEFPNRNQAHPTWRICTHG